MAAEETTKSKILKFLKNAEPGTRQIIASGCIKHMLGLSLKKNSKDSFTLYVADRGYLGDQFSSRDNDKYASIKAVTFKADKLETILGLLYQSDGSERETARKILFEEIPKAAGASYIENPNISQSRYKAPICYFANAKTILYQEFLDQFGDAAGKKMYKQFTTFMRNQVVQDFKKIFGDKNPFTVAGEEIVADKRKKGLERPKLEETDLSRKSRM